MQCSAVQFSAVQCITVQCSAVQCSSVQCSAVHCSFRGCDHRKQLLWQVELPGLALKHHLEAGGNRWAGCSTQLWFHFWRGYHQFLEEHLLEEKPKTRDCSQTASLLITVKVAKVEPASVF